MPLSCVFGILFITTGSHACVLLQLWKPFKGKDPTYASPLSILRATAELSPYVIKGNSYQET
jgi:hypothetical protein